MYWDDNFLPSSCLYLSSIQVFSLLLKSNVFTQFYLIIWLICC